MPVVYKGTDGDKNVYVVYLGFINNTPILSSNSSFLWNGQTKPTLSYSDVSGTSSSVNQSVRTAVIETVSTDSTKITKTGVNAEVSYSFGGGKISASAYHNVETTIKNSKTRTTSVESTWDSVETKLKQSTETVSVTIGDAGEPIGRYRLALFATSDVYLTLVFDDDNTNYDYEFTVCARPGSLTWQVDYDPNTTGLFNRTGGGGVFPLPDDFSSLPMPKGRFVTVGTNNRVMYSDDGINWEESGVTGGGTNKWNEVAFGGGKFIIVGENGMCAISNDGKYFIVSQIIPSNNTQIWNGVVYNASLQRWVAVGNGGYIAYSDNDGVSWTVVQSSGNQYESVAFGRLNNAGAGIFVAVGSAGRVSSSASGLDVWAHTTYNTEMLQSVAYGDGQFVVVGNNQRFSKTINLSDWPNFTNNPSSSSWIGVAYGKAKNYEQRWVAVGGNGLIMYFDGSSTALQAVTTGHNNTYRDVAYGKIGVEHRWVAVGTVGSGGMGFKSSSDDGIIWAGKTDTFNTIWHSVTFGRFFE